MNVLNIPVNSTNYHNLIESAVSNSERVEKEISELKRQIYNELGYVDRSVVDSVIINSIEFFLEDLENKVVAINRGEIFNKKNHVAFGRALVMDMLISRLELALEKKYGQKSFGRLIYIEAGLWPLRSGYIAAEGQLDVINKILKNTIDSFPENRDAFEFRSDNDDSQTNALETANFVWNVLSIITNTTKSKGLAWCEYCFRRAEPNFVTCRLHLSINDTEYKKALRIYEQYSDREKGISARYHALRYLFKEGVKLAGKEFNGEGNENYLSVDIDDAEFIKQVLESSWEHARDILLLKIKEEFPRTAYKISTIQVEEVSTWSQFVQCLYKALNEPIEMNEHPFFVLKLLEISEIYFIYDEEYGDTRTNNTEKNVLKLFAEGFKQVKIAKELSISEQRVSQIVKKSK